MDLDETNYDLKFASIPPSIKVRELANLLNLRPPEIMKNLMEMNVFGSINMEIDFKLASSICARHGVIARKLG